ncbi:SKIP/SNW domain-domain-containing protein [Protomyces lactucae-debilis]|uniref:Pre-mRNA-processing protein 45 n=1 Tax=Protomyces lactucae-debilis TaxID=2754530 RepID=A0A1Y2F7Y0_PROLT|nr:SKIP/SNW domain-containing protein [Protomyces lactucae-debilis]ORY79025.1 SKIP/SNW domain-domain-containing protein [Protomyces lactucae-debilis]
MSGLSKVLPDPKAHTSRKVAGSGSRWDSSDEEDVSSTAPAAVAQSHVTTLARHGSIPAYGHRQGFVPKRAEDYGDGGAYPEINMAQYPRGMGLTSTKSSGGALALQVDSAGKIQYDAIAKQGHGEGRIVQTSFKDLIPIRNQVEAGEISLDVPTEEEVQESAERTNAALQLKVTGQLAAQRPKTVMSQGKRDATFVRYTPASQMGEASDVTHKQRIIKMVDMPEDPLEPPRHRVRKIPRGPGSPPPPVLHSPPRKVSAKERQDWVIPPSISNWKNAKGFTIALDKRLAADGRGLQDTSINDNFAKLSEALYLADRHAREEVKSRSQMQQKIAMREKEKKEEQLRELAQRAREARMGPATRLSRSPSPVVRREASRPRSPVDSRTPPRRRRRRSSSASGSDDEQLRERERLRKERRQEAERAMRVGRMGKDQQMKQLEREGQRDISEKIALGLAKPTASKESMVDQRLFNQTSGMNAGFGAEDAYNLYDKPLFASREAANAIYRPFQRGGQEEEETVENVTKQSRFDVLGKATKGFGGAEGAEAREGPVQFEKDDGDVHPSRKRMVGAASDGPDDAKRRKE